MYDALELIVPPVPEHYPCTLLHSYPGDELLDNGLGCVYVRQLEIDEGIFEFEVLWITSC